MKTTDIFTFKRKSTDQLLTELLDLAYIMRDTSPAHLGLLRDYCKQYNEYVTEIELRHGERKPRIKVVNSAIAPELLTRQMNMN